MQEKAEHSRGAVLFCTDFSEGADFSYRFAVAEAQRAGQSMLYILYVLPEAEAQFWRTYLYEIENVDDKARMDIYNRITNAYIEATPDDLNIKVLIREGRPSEQILQAAKELDAGLIVIGREGSSDLRKPLFGSIVEKIARKASCPVLIVPHSFARKHDMKAKPETGQAGIINDKL